MDKIDPRPTELTPVVVQGYNDTPAPDMVVFSRPHPARVELRGPSPDPSVPLGGRLLAVAEEHGRGWTVFTRGGTTQAVTLDEVIRLVFGGAR